MNVYSAVKYTITQTGNVLGRSRASTAMSRSCRENSIGTKRVTARGKSGAVIARKAYCPRVCYLTNPHTARGKLHVAVAIKEYNAENEDCTSQDVTEAAPSDVDGGSEPVDGGLCLYFWC